jgi:cAMP phosphodiesterase
VKIRVLGTHGSDLLLNEAQGSRACKSVGFLVNEELMVDAGTLASCLTLEEQKRIRHILLSHLHLDHVKGIPPLVDNLAEGIDHRIEVASVSSVLDGLEKHIFNDIVFPNFFAMKGPRESILCAKALEPGKEISLSSEISITPVPVNHTVETVGFIIRDHDSAWVYSGDTYITDEIWRVAAQTPNLKGVLIEVSFPNDMMDLAIRSKHLTPSLLAHEFKKIGKPDIPLYVYHMKPTVRDRIIKELTNLKIPNLHILQEGQEFEL